MTTQTVPSWGLSDTPTLAAATASVPGWNVTTGTVICGSLMGKTSNVRARSLPGAKTSR
jgi:hypothetical protein